MKRKESVTHNSIGPRAVRPIQMPRDQVANYGELARIGINLSPEYVRDMIGGIGFDGNFLVAAVMLLLPGSKDPELPMALLIWFGCNAI